MKCSTLEGISSVDDDLSREQDKGYTEPNLFVDLPRVGGERVMHVFKR